MKKRVMLITIPESVGYANTLADVSFEQIGLGYIASSLKQRGHYIHMLDAYTRNLDIKLILEEIENVDPEVLCLSPTYQSWDTTIDVLNGAKKLNPKMQTILGGPHVSFSPVAERAMKEFTSIDFIIKGEGERSIIPVVEKTDAGTFSNIEGVCFRYIDNTSHISDKLSPQVDSLDQVPFPERDIEPLTGKSLRIATSRGCYGEANGCAFCQMPQQYPNGWRGRSPINVVDEMEYYVNKGHRNFICAEGDFLGLSMRGIRRAGKIADEILRRRLNVRLRIFGGVKGIIAAEKNGVLDTLKKAGLERIYPGIEAGNEEDLKLYEKNITCSQIMRAVDIFKKKGIGLQIGFIMFNPWSDETRLEKNVALLNRIEQSHLWFNFSNKLGLFPGTKLSNKVYEEGLMPKSSDSIGLGSDFVYNYRFKESYMEQIVNACDKILRDELIVQIDRLLCTIGILVADSVSINCAKEVDAAGLITRRQFERVKENLSILNSRTFISIAKVSKNGGSNKQLMNIIKGHLNMVESTYSVIQKCFDASRKMVCIPED